MGKQYSATISIGAVMASSVNSVFGGIESRMKSLGKTMSGLKKTQSDITRYQGMKNKDSAAAKKLAAALREAGVNTDKLADEQKRLARELSHAQREMGRLARASQSVDKMRGAFSRLGSAIRNDFGRALKTSMVGLGGGLALFKTQFLDVAAETERLKTVLRTIEGDQGKADKAFGWISQFAAETPYELQQVTEAFVRLRAYGIDPIRGDALRIMGDTASAMGKDVMDAVEAVADAVTGENERLKEFGIKASKEQGKITYEYTDRAGKQMRKTVDASNRELIQSTVLAIWNDKYKGAMKDQSKTWNGMMSNLKDQWARFTVMVMESGPFTEMKKQLEGFLAKLDEMAKDGTLKAMAEYWGNKMVEFGRKVSDLAIKIWDGVTVLKDFLGGWENLGIALLALNFAPTIVAVGQLTYAAYGMGAAFVAATGPIGLVAIALAALLGAVWYFKDEIGNAVSQVAENWTYKWAEIKESATTAWNDMVVGFGLIFIEIQNKAVEIWEGVKAATFAAIDSIKAKFAEMADWVLGKFTAIGDKIKGLWDGLKSLNPFAEDAAAPGGAGPTSSVQASVVPPSAMPPPGANVAQTNNVNVNINAPGQDGAALAGALRSELNRKPLYDADGVLVPA